MIRRRQDRPQAAQTMEVTQALEALQVYDAATTAYYHAVQHAVRDRTPDSVLAALAANSRAQLTALLQHVRGQTALDRLYAYVASVHTWHEAHRAGSQTMDSLSTARDAARSALLAALGAAPR